MMSGKRLWFSKRPKMVSAFWASEVIDAARIYCSRDASAARRARVGEPGSARRDESRVSVESASR